MREMTQLPPTRKKILGAPFKPYLGLSGVVADPNEAVQNSDFP
jgi:hypothetical protein